MIRLERSAYRLVGLRNIIVHGLVVAVTGVEIVSKEVAGWICPQVSTGRRLLITRVSMSRLNE